MDDLHKPLGQQKAKSSGRRLGVPLLAVATCAMAALVGYLFIQERTSTKAVVAINETDPVETSAKKATRAPDTFDESAEDAERALNREGNGGALILKVPPDADQPAFKPKQKPKQVVSSFVPLPMLVEKSEFGPLPKTADSGMRPLDAYSMSAGAVGPNRVAIVVGGLGLSQSGTKSAIADLPAGVTLAFSPYGNSLNRWMQRAREDGHEVVLQLPMEPLGFPSISPGKRTLNSKAGIGENLQSLRWSLGRMTNYPIVMNYLGAGMASRKEVLKPILEEVRRRGLGWLDDGSVPTSKVIDVAEELKLPNATSSFVLDGVREASRIDSQLTTLSLLAKRRGYAIATASAFPESIARIKAWAKTANKNGILIVPVSNLLRDYER